ncbi:MAG: hypothetical protein HY059_21650 [Proteobacteria bacterium]|nr:hypothetical protein [Pseudomonadota bacterium]
MEFGRFLLAASCFLVLSIGPSTAQSVHRAQIGSEFETKVRFARSEIPLPPGKWKLISTGEEFSVPQGGQQRTRLPFAHLAQIENGRLVALVSMSGTTQNERERWLRDKNCDRTDYLFAAADRNLNDQDQWCQYVTHATRTWISSNDQAPRVAELYRALRESQAALPTTMLSSELRIVRMGEFLRIAYEIAPVEFGGPSSAARTWQTAEWHPQNIAKFPAHREFADGWIAWAQPMLVQVRTGYNGRLAAYEPQPLPVAGHRSLGLTPVRIGTSFTTNAGGGFKVSAVEGMAVTTVNASGAAAHWQLGGMLPLVASSKFDRALAEKIFPLKVGNKTVFDQMSANGLNGWRHTVEVVRSETLKIDGRDYATFVVEDLAKAINDSQGGFVRKRTVWYAPELGWLLKMNEEQLAGAPEKMNSWEVVRIVPPG